MTGATEAPREFVNRYAVQETNVQLQLPRYTQERKKARPVREHSSRETAAELPAPPFGPWIRAH